mgnify:CR=1 FL=1
MLYDNQGFMTRIVKETTCTYYKPIEVEEAQPDVRNAGMSRMLCLWPAEVLRISNARPQILHLGKFGHFESMVAYPGS